MSWALVQSVKVLGSVVAGGLTWTGAAIIAQVDSLRDIPAGIAGGTVLVVAAYIVKWVLKTSKAVEEKWINEISRLETKIEKADAALAACEKKSDDWERKYWELWAKYHGEGRAPLPEVSG